MMRTLLLILSLLLLTPGASHAAVRAERPFYVNMFVRLGHGIFNVASAPSEIYVNSLKEVFCGGPAGTYLNEVSNGFAGAIVGIGYTVLRVGNGIFEIATFPAPFRPLMDPATTPIFLEGIIEDPTSEGSNRTCERR